MIKVICITNTTSSGEHLYLTKGKIYDTYEGTYDKWWYIYNDLNMSTLLPYNKYLFIPLSEYRDNQIDSIFKDDI